MPRKGASVVQVWNYPVALRLVEVNTKTGFSLTAGSYSVRASSMQAGVITYASAGSATAAVSAVTLTRATIEFGGTHANTNDFTYSTMGSLSATTTALSERSNTGAGTTNNRFIVTELF